ncbi:hypothetical protein Tco_1152574 [Tanacetum coccineum]
MDAPTLPALAGLSEEGQDDTTDIRVDRIHPVPVAEVVFLAATVMATLARHGEAIRGIREHLQGVSINEEMMALRFRVEIAEAENASLRGRIRTLEAMDTITCGQEKRARRRMEQQLASVTETLREMQTKMGALQAQQARAPGPHSSPEDADSSKRGINERVFGVECFSYLDFLKCQPLNFKGTEGVVGLMQWFERMETVYRISNYSVENHIKFATCNLLGSALTWWNSHVATVSHDNAYAMTWLTQKKKMTDKYCLRGKMRKLEVKLWELKADKAERYVGGLPDMIHGSVMASRPKTMQDAIEFATELMDQKITMWLKLTPPGRVKGRSMLEPSHCVISDQSHIMARALAKVAGLGYAIKVPPFDEGLSDCPRFKNQNNVNQAGGSEEHAKVYALGGGETDQDLHDVEEDIDA